MEEKPVSPVVEIPLTKGYVAIVDEIDSDFALLNWYSSVQPHTVYAERLDLSTGTRTIVRMHRLILERVLNRRLKKGEYPDHIDHDGLNNTRKNLRLANSSENGANARLNSNNTSGYKGVTWDKSKRMWAASITVNRKPIHLGRFLNIRDAVIAYNEAAEKHFREFASLNEVPLDTQDVERKMKTVSRRNISGFRGVSWNKKNLKWVSMITVNYKPIYVGTFADLRDAVMAYNAAAIEYFGEKAVLNEVPPPPAEEEIAQLEKLRRDHSTRKNSTGFRGVRRQRARWIAVIMPPGGRQTYLGSFDNILDAARAYNKAAIEHFGAAAVLNDVPPGEAD
jgi:hypothetical protein